MIKFNDSNIIVGHIKQLLNSFNLPKYKIYKNDDELITNSYYIKNNDVQFYKNNNIWKFVKDYEYNVRDINFTKRLKITNNIYDDYTHEYLGEYLRFLRDYNNLDLMPLYNCFSNKVVEDLNLKLTTKTDASTDTTAQFGEFVSKNQSYKIYMVPIKLFQQYTIALDCDAPLEMCCGFYGKYQFADWTGNDTKASINDWAGYTYMKISKMSFSTPLLYTKLLYKNIQDSIEDDNYATSMYKLSADTFDKVKQNDHDLKLFIKVPAGIRTSIVVLEGDYTNWDNKKITLSNGLIKTQSNKFVTNYEGPIKTYMHKEGDKYDDHLGYQEDQVFTPISRLQLLTLNTKESYPFADRLIEYLVDNVIDNRDEISDNIKRVATVVNKNVETKINTVGAWTTKIRPITYDFMLKTNDIFDTNHDLLGYIDKDTETKYLATEQQGTETIKTTIANVDIYGEEK